MSLTAFPVTRTAHAVIRNIGLTPETHPGTTEVIETILRLHIEAQKTSMSATDFQEGVSRCTDFWRFQVDMSRDYAAPFYASADDIPDALYCALIGGIDLLLDGKIRPWKSAAAKRGASLITDAGNIKNADDQGGRQ